MQEIYLNNLVVLLRNKSKLERSLKVKFTNRGKNVFIEGAAENEYIALKVLEAIDLDFSVERALLLKDENNILQILNIKGLTKRKDLRQVKGRIIGTHGRALKTLNTLTDCYISTTDNQVGIIGDCETIDTAINAVNSIIQGSKHGNVYSRLEKDKKRIKEDIGIIKNESKDNKD